MIREVRADELTLLRAIETAAGEVFRELGMDEIADDAPLAVEELAAYQGDGRAWVSVDGADRPIAYLLMQRVDDSAHVEQISVHPDHARRGRGKALIDVAGQWSYEQGLTGLTLTTFEDVPWNAPYYRRLGFRILQDDEIPEGLRAIRRQETQFGLDRWPRVAMRNDLPKPRLQGSNSTLQWPAAE